MHFPHAVTFEAPTATQLPSGQEVRSYAPIEDLTDLPARIIPVVTGRGGVGETVGDRMVVERDMFTVVVQGDRDIDYSMRMVSDHLAFPLSVVQFQRPVLYRSPLTNATIIGGERVTATSES
jgi:hypothetical protein